MLRLYATVGFAILLSWFFVRAVQFSLLDFVRITNESMIPYLTPGQTVVLNKLSPCGRIPFTRARFACKPCKIGRAYVFADPKNTAHKLVKFAVQPHAREKSDIIWFTNQAKHAVDSSDDTTSCYFEGANREHSIDSRHFGRIPLEQIEGQVVYPHVQL